MWSQIVAWDQKNYVMSAGSSGTAMGIVGSHAYTVISTHVLKTNGKRLLKIRNPWGRTEWSGSYRDSDAFWTSSTTAAEDKALIVNKDDGIFFMTIEDFKVYFSALTGNPDTSKWQLSYWMKLGNANTFGKTGSFSACGSTCKHNKFTITSPVAQTIYVATHVPMERQYVEAPCTNAFDWTIN